VQVSPVKNIHFELLLYYPHFAEKVKPYRQILHIGVRVSAKQKAILAQSLPTTSDHTWIRLDCR
jgi:hypothetical protein